MKKALILGAGESGRNANKLLKKLGYSTFIIDEKKKIRFDILRDRLFESLSLVIVSPGVSLDHELIKLAKKRGIEVIGELELGARNLVSHYIAITGTNGKTTTTTLTKELLENKNCKTFAGGNIGVAVCSFAQSVRPIDNVVLEVSSFQLESIDTFKPHVATILNITPDHLNRHKTMENYINAKLRIFENQTDKDYAVINLDDPILKSIDFSFVKSQIYYFSTKIPCKGCFVYDGCIYFNNGISSTFVMKTSAVPLAGEHNLSNVLAALTSAILSGVEISELQAKVMAFKGVSHRLEFISEIKGVSYINDSKSTNISSTIVAMKAMSSETTLILGGSDKGFMFDELFENLSPLIKNIIVLGQTKEKLLACARKYSVDNVYEANSFKEAVYLASSLAENGENVLLSPACASFDMFLNYEQRGRAFAKIVREIEKSESRIVKGKKTK